MLRFLTDNYPTKKEARQVDSLEVRLNQIQTQLENRQKQKERVRKAIELTGDEETFKQDIDRLMMEMKGLTNEKQELESRIENYQQHEIDAERIKQACNSFSANLRRLT